MRANLRLATLALCLATLAPELAAAQNQPPPPAQRQSGTFSPGEIVGEGHKFFGTVSRGLAQVVEAAFSRWGQPNGYILGQEGSGAFIVGLRYGDGKLYTKNAGDRRVFWEGPSVGFDYGGEGARTMMLVYNLPATGAIYQRFAGIDGSAYFIGGFGMPLSLHQIFASVWSGWLATWPTQLLALIWIGWLVSWMLGSFWSARTEKRPVTWRARAHRLPVIVGGLLLTPWTAQALGERPLWNAGNAVTYALALVVLAGVLFTCVISWRWRCLA